MLSIVAPIAIITGLLGSFFIGLNGQRNKFIGASGFLVADFLWIAYAIGKADGWLLLQFGAFTATALIALWNSRPSKWEKNG